MVRRPDLGYGDEGLDFGDPASFEPQRREFGAARVMPRLAYRSLQFLYLEDEAIWTRAWIPVGSEHEITDEGDLLPFTLGYHGVHLQRMAEGRFEARFNMAQHGGCRVVPTQCQQGKRTSCSFTSCGYSRDRGPIQADEGREQTRLMYQYLGLRPERLHPVQVAQAGALLLLNIDPDPAGGVPQVAGLPPQLTDPEAGRVYRSWTEGNANWKLAGQALARVDRIAAADPLHMTGHRAALDGSPLEVHWLFPNAVLLVSAGDCCLIVLQHTAIDQTMFRIEILSRHPLSDARQTFWEAVLSAARTRAEELQGAVPKKAALDLPVAPSDLPVQTEPAAWWFQNALIDRVGAMPRVGSDVPIFRNVEHYLI
ncbi:MAG: Rieske (2Fe-2S) protein [Rhodobacteraceae bacterium]|nr:Rieske (2Fe-2S) protein [Paracoccaceae bacterium]